MSAHTTEVETVTESKSLNTIADRVHAVREDLFESTAIIDIARRAVSPDEDWYLHFAIQGAINQLDAACSALELIARDASEPVEVMHAVDQAAEARPNAALALVRASDTLEEIDAIVNVAVSVIRSGSDLGADLAVVLDGAWAKISAARADVDTTLAALEGTANA